MKRQLGHDNAADDDQRFTDPRWPVNGDDGPLTHPSDYAEYQALFFNTFLEPFSALFFVASPDRTPIVVLHHLGSQYNMLRANLYFASVPSVAVHVEIRQASQAMDTDDDAYPSSYIIDLADKTTTDPDVRALQQLAWGDSVKAVVPFDFTAPGNGRGQKTTPHLWKTFTHVARFIAGCQARHPAGEVMHILIRCKNGVERSLLLFNVVGFALSLLRNAGHAHDYQASLSGLISQTGMAFKPRLIRFGLATERKQVHTVDGGNVVATLKQLYAIFERTLKRSIRATNDDDTTVSDASPVKRRK